MMKEIGQEALMSLVLRLSPGNLLLGWLLKLNQGHI